MRELVQASGRKGWRTVLRLANGCMLLMACLSAQAQFISFNDVLQRPERPQPDHRIAYGPLSQQFGELWLPHGRSVPRGVVLMVHGGCWRADLPGPELLAWQADALRREGLAVWSISYRRWGHEGGGYPGTFQDVAMGAEHLRQLAKTHALDLGRVVATGHSAGGHLALWLAARANLPAESPLATPHPLPVQAVVAVAGMGDLSYAARLVGPLCGMDTIANLVDEKTRGKDAWADTSPLALLPLGVPQVMVSGVYDPIVAPTHARRWQHLAGARGDTVSLRTLDESGHFELIAPWTAAGQATVRAIVEQLDSLQPAAGLNR